MGGQYVLSAISIVASVLLTIYILKLGKEKKTETFSFSLILGGAFGNLIDRALYGKVVDFIDCDFPDFIMERWPVYNIADSAITIGMVILFIFYMFFDKKKEEDTDDPKRSISEE